MVIRKSSYSLDIPNLSRFGMSILVVTILCEIAFPSLLVWGLVELALWAFQ
jgi:hypothetical protein